MALSLFAQFVIWLVVTLLTELLRPKPELEDARAATFEEFGVPSVDPSRPIPVACGLVRITSPQLLWYGDYRTVAIEEEVRTGLFSKDEFIKGYKYYIGVHLSLARSLDEFHEILWDDESLHAFGGSPVVPITTDTTVSINKPDFLGGEEGPSAQGGIVGDFTFRFDSPTKAVSTYLAGFQTPTQAYRHIAELILEGVYIGLQPSLKPPAIIGARFPNDLGVTAAQARVGNGANPVCFIYELLINDDYGLNIDSTLINVTQFQKMARRCKIEGYSYSNLWTQLTQIGNVINDILQQIDAVMYMDPLDGLITIDLIRAADETSPNLTSVVTLNESNIMEVESFTRVNWFETSNRVVVNWKDPTRSKRPPPALQDDMANQRIQGGRNIVETFNYSGIDDNNQAARVSARELRALSYPLGKVSLIANRDAYELRPGDLFIWVWPDLDITSMTMRVLSVALGADTDIRIRVDAIEDVYSLGDTVYADPATSAWVNPTTQDPTATLADACFEAPLMLDRLSPVTSPLVPAAEEDSRIVLMPVAAQQNTLGFRMMEGGPGSPSSLDAVVGDFAQMCPSGLLAHPIALGDYINPSSPNTITVSDAVDLRNLEDATAHDIRTQLANLFVIDNEMFAFETRTFNADGSVTLAGIHRAMLDTVPAVHASSPSTRVYFIGMGTNFAGGITDTRYVTGGSGSVGARTNTSKGILGTGSANLCAFTATSRILKPMPPKNLRFSVPSVSPEISDSYFPSSLPRADWVIEWDVRDRTAMVNDDVDDSTTQGFEAGTVVVLQFVDLTASPQVVREVITSPVDAETYTYTVAQQDTDFGGGAGSPGAAIGVRLFSRRTAAPQSGLESHQRWNLTITRT